MDEVGKVLGVWCFKEGWESEMYEVTTTNDDSNHVIASHDVAGMLEDGSTTKI